MAINVGTAVAYLDLNMTAFNSGLQQAQSALQTFENTSSTLGRNMMAAGGIVTNIGSGLTRNITMPLVAAGQEVVQFGADFDKQMSAVQAVMQNRLKDGDFERLREAAIHWGNETVYTATEAAEALYYMGLAGWDADQAINGLGNVLNLAAAGQMDLGRASDVVTDSMTAMRLEAGEYTNEIENTAYYTSVLAAVMANSNTDIDKLGESFKYVAPIAGDLEYKIEDLGTVLGLVANAGIKSSQAGTSVRQALKQLISPTDKTREAMEKYGISLFDATGNALPLIDVVLQLREKFGGLNLELVDTNGEFLEGEEVMQDYANALPITQQEKLAAVVDMFGTRAMPAMLSIIDEGETNFYELRDAIDEAAKTGTYAADMAHTQLDNLAGDWVYFTSAMGTAKILLSDIVNGELRQLVQWATEMVRQFNELDQTQKEQIIKWALIAAAVGPVLMLFGNLLRSIGLVSEGFRVLHGILTPLHDMIKYVNAGWEGMALLIGGEESGGLISIIAKLGSKFGWIVGIIAVVIAAIIDLWQNNEEFRENMIRIWNAILDVIKSVWGFVEPIFQMLIQIFMEVARAIEPILVMLADVLAPLMEVIAVLIKTIFDALSPLIDIIGTTLVAAIRIAGTVIKGVVKVLTPILEIITAILEAVLGLANVIIDALGGALRALAELWNNFWNWVYKTASEFWEKITEKFRNSWLGKLFTRWGDLIHNAMEGIADMFKNGSLNVSGSHANGLAYVPYDGYIAELHKGERVLTAQENARYSSTSGNGTTINFYSNERIDEYTAAKELRRTMKDMELGLV